MMVAKDAGTEVTGRVDGVSAGAAQGETNCQNGEANQEWSQVVHQAGIAGIATG